jgi:hypothetical protein
MVLEVGKDVLCFRRTVAVLAFLLLVSSGSVAFGQDSSSNQPAQQEQAQPQAPAPSQQAPVTVQARIKARRAARREQAIHDTYSHPYELFLGAGYQRFTPGPTLQRSTMYAFDTAITRYWSERLGLTIDGRGNYGTAFTRPNFSSITRPAISTYDFQAGPVYRIKMRPKYSIAGRVMGGLGMSNFTGDTNGFGSICPPGQACLLYKDSNTYLITPSIIGEANISPTLSLRLAGEDMIDGYGSKMQNDFGATFGFVVRFGKQ